MSQALRDIIPIMGLLQEMRVQGFKILCTEPYVIARFLKTTLAPLNWQGWDTLQATHTHIRSRQKWPCCHWTHYRRSDRIFQITQQCKWLPKGKSILYCVYYKTHEDFLAKPRNLMTIHEKRETIPPVYNKWSTFAQTSSPPYQHTTSNPAPYRS